MLVNSDSDLEVGEFGIATRMVQPEPGQGSPDEPLPEATPGATMVYKPEGPPTQAATPGELGVEPEVVTLDENGKRHEIDKASVVIGRSKDCDIRLADPNVSRRHAELRQQDGAYWILDLGSTNGLTVNGRRQQRAQLENDDRITVGSTDLVFRRSVCMIGASVDVEGVLLLLKAGFLVLLYLFIWRIVRTASRDLRLPQESFVLGPQQAAAMGLRCRAPDEHGPPRRDQEQRDRREHRVRARLVRDLDRPRRAERRPARRRRLRLRGPRSRGAAPRRRLDRRRGLDQRHLRQRRAPLEPARKLAAGDLVRVGETDLRFEA